jgi:hypothetical protein
MWPSFGTTVYMILSIHADKWVIALRKGVNTRSANTTGTIEGWHRALKLWMALFCPHIHMRRLDQIIYILTTKDVDVKDKFVARRAMRSSGSGHNAKAEAVVSSAIVKAREPPSESHVIAEDSGGILATVTDVIADDSGSVLDDLRSNSPSAHSQHALHTLKIDVPDERGEVEAAASLTLSRYKMKLPNKRYTCCSCEHARQHNVCKHHLAALMQLFPGRNSVLLIVRMLPQYAHAIGQERGVCARCSC